MNQQNIGKYNRLFIAIDPTREVKANIMHAIIKLQHEIGKNIITNWTKDTNLHITLKYLGETPYEKISSLYHAVKEIAKTKQVFTIEAHGLGAFPSLEHARTIFIGINDLNHELALLAQEIAMATYKLGFMAETRPFQPHITIAKIKNHGNVASMKQILTTAFNRSFGKIKVAALTLYESKTLPTGSIYEALLRVPLGDKNAY